jgi:folate-binding protein YgfZ
MSAADRLASELATLEGGAGVLALPDAGVVRVSGPGHRDVLQRVLSQDLDGLDPGRGRLALLLTPKGQFRAVMAVFGGAGETQLLAPPGRAAEVAGALSKFLMLSRCTAQADASAGVAVVGAAWLDAAAAAGADRSVLAGGATIVGTGWLDAAAAAAADPAAVAGGDADSDREALWFGRTMLGVAGATAVGSAWGALHVAGGREVSREAIELLRIRHGVPVWGNELTGTTLPPEVGIEGEAISSTKGCYVGQETMARMATYGHPTRSLAGLRQVGGPLEPPELPLPLTAAGEDRPRASLTSWGLHPQHGGVGLALVRRELAVPGTHLASPGRVFEVASFPLW